jgi:serine/threonine protein kinase
MLAHMENPVPDIISLRKANLTEEQRAKESRVPSWLLNVISRCLSKNPQERYANGMELQEAVISGSLAAAEAALSGTVPIPQSSVPPATGDGASADATSLVQENERLQNLVNQYQQEKQDVEQERISEFSTSRVYMSRPVFTGLIVLLLIFMIFSGYALFFKRQANLGAETDTDTSAVQQPDTTTAGNNQTPQMESNYNNTTVPATDSASRPALNNAQRSIDSVIKRNRELQRRRQQERDSSEEETGDTTTATPPSTDASDNAAIDFN